MNIKKKLEKYILENQQQPPLFKAMKSSINYEECCASVPNDNININNYLKDNKEDSFQTKLFEYIDKKKLKDSDVYNKVNIDRRLFSKIRNSETYHPKKETVILLAISLELSEEEMESLLESASYSLPKNSTFDLIIRFCFKEKIYDINQINEFLYDYNCQLLNE